MTPPITKALEPPPRLTPSKLVNILWASAVDAFVKAIILLVMGSIALGLIGAIFEEMAPSLPPFLAAHSSPGSTSNSSVLHRSWASIREHEFFIVFAVFFVLCARTRLATAGVVIAGQRESAATRLQKLGAQVSQDWFRLFVGNAFGALVSAIVIYFVERFTGAGFLLNLLLAALIPGLRTIAIFVFGSALVNFVGGLVDWYGDNQLRFNFWLLYIAAVCDDLGLPNLKTLARFLWSRWRSQKPATGS